MTEPAVHVAQSKCPFCHDTVEVQDRAVCATCVAVHHLACWTEHGACAACGGEQVLTLQQRMVASKIGERIEELGSTDKLVRRWAAYSLRNAAPEDRPALEALRRTLDDEDRWTRMWSAVALGKLGVPDAKVLDRLEVMAADPDEPERTREHAEAALRALRGKGK